MSTGTYFQTFWRRYEYYVVIRPHTTATFRSDDKLDDVASVVQTMRNTFDIEFTDNEILKINRSDCHLKPGIWETVFNRIQDGEQVSSSPH